MTLGVMQGVRLCVSVVSGIELAGLFHAYQANLTSWEPLWVIMMETVSYFMRCIDPDAGKIELASGGSIAWFQYVGWLVTCPVLLMFLVTMTTYGGNATVRLVPLLVCNQCMILAGVTSQVYDDKLLKWLIYAISLAFGGSVFLMSSSCLLALYHMVNSNHFSPDQRKRGKRVATLLAASFISGWFLFPLSFTFGQPGLGLIAEEVEESMMMLGDFLAKNCFVVLAAVIKRHYLAPLLTKSQAALPVGHPNIGRRPSTIAICPAALENPTSRLSYSSLMASEMREMHQASHL